MASTWNFMYKFVLVFDESSLVEPPGIKPLAQAAVDWECKDYGAFNGLEVVPGGHCLILTEWPKPFECTRARVGTCVPSWKVGGTMREWKIIGIYILYLQIESQSSCWDPHQHSRKSLGVTCFFATAYPNYQHDSSQGTSRIKQSSLHLSLKTHIHLDSRVEWCGQ